MTEKCLNCLKECNLKCSNCKVVYFCNRDCQKNAWKKHKAFCKSVSNPTNVGGSQTCLIIDGFGPCGSGWDDMVNGRQVLLQRGMNVMHINGGKGGSSLPIQVASLLKSPQKPQAMIFFGFGSGGDGSDGHFYKLFDFQKAVTSWCQAGGRFIVQGERVESTGNWPQWFGKDWKNSSYYRTDHKCHANSNDDQSWCTWYSSKKGAVPSRYNVKACMLTNVEPQDVLFGAQEGARSYSLVPGFGGEEIDESNTAVAFARYGEGTVSYFGDVNHEQETLEIMSVIAMGN